MEAFVARIQELPYADKRSLHFRTHYARGDPRRLIDLAAEIAASKPEAIIATSTPATYAASLATNTIPIVMCGTLDAQAAGLVDSLARPAGDITGLTAISLELVPTRLQLLREVTPKASRLGFLGSRTTQIGGALADYERLNRVLDSKIEQALDEVTRSLGIHVQNVYARGVDEVRDAFAQLSEDRAEGLYVLESPGLMIDRRAIADLAIRNRLPTISGTRQFAEAGGLLSYGADLLDVYRKTADYVSRILAGAKPGDLPIEQPTKYDLVINLRTAKSLGLTIPQSMLVRANDVIR
jgi:putative ABC transport system substrate-binding protein